MQYRVPQFIEHDAKILGPLNMKQSLLIGGVIAICFFLYFAIGQENFFLFLLIAAALTGIALALGFGQIQGQPLPKVMINFANFNVNPKMFLWKRKQTTVYLSVNRQDRPNIQKTIEKKSDLKVAPRGKINQLIRQIDFEKTEE
ncbi:MAG: hypothetical protein PHD31_01620 [Candidatus Pacebacteria bacterium]|nr:hypothetical protein [Candidatus Paceibacterota bacterium]